MHRLNCSRNFSVGLAFFVEFDCRCSFLYICLLADEGAEGDDELAGDADKVELPEVYAKAESRHVYGEENRPHHDRDYHIIEVAVMPDRIEYKPHDRCRDRRVYQR